MDYDVFLSYPHADRAEVMQICKALRSRELTVWMDESDIPDYASITRSIVDGLARSRVLLAYYSLNYSRSRACQWELAAAFLAAQHEGDPLRRVLVTNPEEKLEHIHPVQLRDAEIPDSNDLDRLASSVKTHVTEIEGAIGEIHALKPPKWYGRKGVGSNRFVGRLSYMWQIHSALHASDFPIITDATAAYEVAQVYGMGGVGKSLLTEEYALRFAAAFPGGVFWLSAFGNDDVKAGLDAEGREAERSGQIRGIAAALGIPVQDRSPEEIEGALKWKLGAIEKPFLWVVDDLPAGMDEDTLQRWLAPHPLGKTLITTRTREHDALGELISLGVLEPEEAYKLLTSRRRPKGTDEEAAAYGLVKDLGCHALALDVAGAALRAYAGIQSFVEFRKNLSSSSSDRDVLELAKDFTGILPNGHEKSIASTFLRSIDRLDHNGWDFLRLASGLAVAQIPASLVSSVFRNVDGLDDALAQHLASLAMDQAENFSLAERRAEDEEGAISVHTLISRTVRFRDSEPERSTQLRDAAVKVLVNRLSKVDDPQTHAELKLAVIHARELVNRSEDLSASKLMMRVALYDYVRAAYKSAENLNCRAWEIRDHLLGGEHPGTLASMCNLALTLQSQGDLDRAKEIQEEELEIARRVLGDGHPSTLTSMNNLATTLLEQGDFAGARELQEQVLKLKQRTLLGILHPLDDGTLKSMNNLALTLQAQGDLGRAREIQEEVLEITRRKLGDEHPDTLRSMGNLATTLRAQGDLIGAREIQEQVLEITRKVLVPEHPRTLKSMGNLAMTLYNQGDLDQAREIQEEVLEITRRKLGDEHPHTLLSINSLARTLLDQGDFAVARELEEQVLEISRRIQGHEHPNTLSSMNILAGTLQAQGELERAREIQEQVLKIRRRIHGDEHPDTLMSMGNLAGTLLDQRDFAGARDLQEQVLEITRRIHGGEHPTTLTSMNNLAMTLQSQGDLDRAKEIQEEALETIRRVLGDEHPNTLTSMNNLAGTLRAQGDLAGAREILEEVLETIRRVLGDEHPNTLTSMNNLAVMFHAQGDLAGAREIQEQVLETLRRVLGDEHPNTITSMKNLAMTLWKQGDLSSTRELEEQVLDITRRVFGDEHPDTLRSMSHLAETLQAQGELERAREIHEQVLQIRQRVLGDEHLHTLASMNKLAMVFSDQGELEKARELHEQVLEMRRRILGDEHPDTSVSAQNLFSIYRAMGDSAGAMAVLENELLWLLDRDPTSLGTDQQKIRKTILQIREKP